MASRCDEIIPRREEQRISSQFLCGSRDQRMFGPDPNAGTTITPLSGRNVLLAASAAARKTLFTDTPAFFSPSSRLRQDIGTRQPVVWGHRYGGKVSDCPPLESSATLVHLAHRHGHHVFVGDPDLHPAATPAAAAATWPSSPGVVIVIRTFTVARGSRPLPWPAGGEQGPTYAHELAACGYRHWGQVHIQVQRHPEHEPRGNASRCPVPTYEADATAAAAVTTLCWPRNGSKSVPR